MVHLFWAIFVISYQWLEYECYHMYNDSFKEYS